MGRLPLEVRWAMQAARGQTQWTQQLKIRATRDEIDELVMWVGGENVETTVSGPNEAGIFDVKVEAPIRRAGTHRSVRLAGRRVVLRRLGHYRATATTRGPERSGANPLYD